MYVPSLYAAMRVAFVSKPLDTPVQECSRNDPKTFKNIPDASKFVQRAFEVLTRHGHSFKLICFNAMLLSLGGVCCCECRQEDVSSMLVSHSVFMPTFLPPVAVALLQGDVFDQVQSQESYPQT